MPGEELAGRVEHVLAAPAHRPAGTEGSSDRRRHPPGHPGAVRRPAPEGHLRAELATHPRGVRPADLITALGTDAVPGRACRTHQWIERDGARFEPLPRERARDRARARHSTRGGPSLMSETEISQTPEGRPLEGHPRRALPRKRRALADRIRSRPMCAPGQGRPPGLRKPKIGDTRPAPPCRPGPAGPVARPRPRRSRRPWSRSPGRRPPRRWRATPTWRARRARGPDSDDAEPPGRRPRSRRRSGRDRRAKQVGPLPGLRARPAGT